MKKLLNKLRRKNADQAPARITNDTIAEHRERILAGGRRFKYPIQYARHRLVINAVIVAVAAIVLLVTVLWWQLYLAQNSSDLIYRITRVVPLPVATVDKTSVPFSDYLMKYRSSLHYLVEKEQISVRSDDGMRQVDHIKQESMQDALRDAYARQIASEKGISVSDAEVQSFINKQRGDVSESTYNAVILDYYGWTPQEYEYVMKNKLLLQKVSYAVDETATATVDALREALKDSKNFKKIAEALNKNPKTVVEYGVSGLVSTDKQQDGGLTAAASLLKKGQVSTVIQPTTGEGYYVVKVTSNTDSQVNYEYIHVRLMTFEDTLASLKKDGKIDIYIDIPSPDEITSK